MNLFEIVMMDFSGSRISDFVKGFAFRPVTEGDFTLDKILKRFCYNR